MLNIDHSNKLATTQYGDREKCFKTIFRESLEELEARIMKRLRGNGNRLKVLRDPSVRPSPRSIPSASAMSACGFFDAHKIKRFSFRR
jgi:hypothetical protein